MQSLSTKVTGDSLTAPEWNQLPSEIQNVIIALGQSLSGADLNQLGKAIAGYAANGVFYTDSGAVNAYVLTTIGSKQSPTAYTDGLRIVFFPGAAPTGASTVNVGGLGLKDLRDPFGNALADSAMSTVVPAEFTYSASAGHFRMATAEPVSRTAPWSVTHNMASDANYTLTATQEQYGRINITDTGVLLTTTRSIICSKAIRQYTVVNGTAQSLLFKTSAGAGITIGSGVTADVYCDGTNVLSDVPTLLVGHGECRLDYVSATQIKLSRRNGKYLMINGTAEVLPSAGITLANTALTASTLYYIYAYMAAGVMTLEASTTAHSADATTGVEIKTGDATRTYVGNNLLNASSQFTSNVNSYFNSDLFLNSYNSGNQTITSAGQLLLSHGLGKEPWLVQCFLKCLTAENGYSVGAKIKANLASDAASNGASVAVDSTTITVRFGSVATTTFAAPNGTTGTSVALTNANWAFIVEAYA